MNKRIKNIITEGIVIKQQILSNTLLLDTIEKVTEVCILALKGNKKLLFCGNGGSAADAQHIASELTGRFYKERFPLNAEALHTDTSFMTAVSNDYGYEETFARMVNAKGQIGDVFFAISTSGNSANILRAVEEARKNQLLTVAMTGATGGKLAGMTDFLINVPSTDTPRIQECHIMIGHILCELIEATIFKEN